MDVEAGEFHDWELLPDQNSSRRMAVNSPHDVVLGNVGGLEEIERDSEGSIIRSDYFSLEFKTKCAIERSDTEGALIADASAESDIPSWIDPGSDEASYSRKDLGGEPWPDSSSDRSSDVRRVGGELEPKDEFHGTDNRKPVAAFDVVGGEIGNGSENLVNFWEDSGAFESSPMMKSVEVEGRSEAAKDDNGYGEEGVGHENVVNASSIKESKRGIVWWKLPLDFLMYSIFRYNPVWTLSVAAAMMGFVILGRRFYKMKRKSRSLSLKVTIDDKKVSRFMSRAARLNEAFSVVKRVPIIRPSLPTAGITPWPMMSLR